MYYGSEVYRYFDYYCYPFHYKNWKEVIKVIALLSLYKYSEILLQIGFAFQD